MRIGVVGKGGSGKSTIACALASYLQKNASKPVAFFDADINMHALELLGFALTECKGHISQPKHSKNIKEWLIGENKVKSLEEVRKTTPPTSLSNILSFENILSSPLKDIALKNENLLLFIVGTYTNAGIGQSCYHNSLGVFETLLNHLDDRDGYVVADMVAGTDAFAGTLHKQFDLTLLVTEPTRRSVEVSKQYIELGKEAKIQEQIFVIGNKVRDDSDIRYLQGSFENKFIEVFHIDDHILDIDKTGAPLSSELLSSKNKSLLGKVKLLADDLPDIRNKRLKNLWDLHKVYVSQSFIQERFGDLTSQIDRSFQFE